MNWSQLTSTDLVTDASPGQLVSRINSQLSLHPLTSFEWTYHASELVQSVTGKCE